MPKSSKGLLETTGNVVVALLKAVHSSADALPPLKGATGGALRIVELVSVRPSFHNLQRSMLTATQTFHSNSAKWIEFGDYIGDAVARIVHNVGIDPSTPDDAKKDFDENIKKLQE